MSLKITFEGNLIDLEGKTYGSEPLKNLLLLLINDFPKYPDPFYVSSVAQINDDIKNVHWKMSSEPYFNAFMRPATNEIGMNLVAILSVLAIPIISKYINDLLEKPTISINDAKNYIEKIPDQLLTELDKLFSSWAKVHEEGKPKVHEEGKQRIWNLAHFPLIKDFFFFEPIGRFLIWHEVAHWNLLKFNNHTKSRFFDQTQFHVDSYLKEFHSKDAISNMVNFHLKNDEIRSNWMEEITCDVMSSFAYFTKFSEDYQRREFYASLAIIFGILQWYTYFITRFYGSSPSYISHPPVAFRRDILYYIIAKERNMTIKDFIQYEFGAGFMADNILSGILNKYTTTY